MVGKLLVNCFMPGMIVGLIYLVTIMWWQTGYTPIGLIETVTDTIVQPLQQVAETLRH